jgi:sugar O-acyltransferase (sialic acid O-acetyltransferase NeuD family)
MNVIIIGAGGHGRVVLDILTAMGTHQTVGFIDADPQLAGKAIGDVPILGQANLLPKLKSQKVKGAIVAIGDNHARRSYAAKLAQQGFELINAIHPRSIVSPTAKLGTNLVIAAGAVIGTDAVIGNDVIVNTAAVIDHECEIGQAVHICPGAALAGRVHVGEEAFIGLGSNIIPCMNIGRQSVVGAGAVVIADVPEGATVVGVPARVIKLRSNSPQHAAV